MTTVETGGEQRTDRDGRQPDVDELHVSHVHAKLAELSVALEQGTVTFHDVAHAWFGAHDGEIDQALRDRYADMFRELLTVFSAERGGIESDYFCEHIKVAAALTDVDFAAQSNARIDGGAESEDGGLMERWRERHAYASASALHVEPLLGDPRCPRSRGVLSRSLDLHYRALEFLAPQHRKVCLRRIFTTVTALLGTLDERARRSGSSDDCVLTDDEAAGFDHDLDEAEAYYLKHAQRKAQMRYIAGCFLGLVPVLALLAILTALPGVELREPIVVALFAGSLGAIVSVMMRVRRGRLVIEPETTDGTSMLLGAVRPAIGAVFGGLLLVLIEGEILAPAGLENADYVTYAGLAFLAGFSERVATSVVSSGSAALTGDEPASGASGGGDAMPATRSPGT